MPVCGEIFLNSLEYYKVTSIAFPASCMIVSSHQALFLLLFHQMMMYKHSSPYFMLSWPSYSKVFIECRNSYCYLLVDLILRRSALDRRCTPALNFPTDA